MLNSQIIRILRYIFNFVPKHYIPRNSPHNIIVYLHFLCVIKWIRCSYSITTEVGNYLEMSLFYFTDLWSVFLNQTFHFEIMVHWLAIDSLRIMLIFCWQINLKMFQLSCETFHSCIYNRALIKTLCFHLISLILHN